MKMSALIGAPLVAWLIATAPAAAQTMLVTEAEMLASQAAGDLLMPRSAPVPGAPRIELVTPDVRAPVSTPTRILLRFFGSAPAQPRPESFRVLYGMLKLDITSRLLGLARVTPEGLDVAEATLPRGTHALTLRLEDSVGRATTQTVQFTVQ